VSSERFQPQVLYDFIGLPRGPRNNGKFDESFIIDKTRKLALEIQRPSDDSKQQQQPSLHTGPLAIEDGRLDDDDPSAPIEIDDVGVEDPSSS